MCLSVLRQKSSRVISFEVVFRSETQGNWKSSMHGHHGGLCELCPAQEHLSGEAVGAVVIQPEFYPWSNGLWPGAASAKRKGPLCLFSSKHRTDWGWSDSHNGVQRLYLQGEAAEADAASRLVLRNLSFEFHSDQGGLKQRIQPWARTEMQ